MKAATLRRLAGLRARQADVAAGEVARTTARRLQLDAHLARIVEHRLERPETRVGSDLRAQGQFGVRLDGAATALRVEVERADLTLVRQRAEAAQQRARADRLAEHADARRREEEAQRLARTLARSIVWKR